MVRDGYRLHFECTYGGGIPNDLHVGAAIGGWELRRRLKAWCESHGITDYIIYRATDYVKDLHGKAVYELWVRSYDRKT